MHNGSISRTSLSLFYEHGAVNGRRPVFDKMVESGKGLECFPNNARIAPEKVEKRTVNYLIRKIDKAGSADRASGCGRHRSARTHENIHLQPRRLTNSG